MKEIAYLSTPQGLVFDDDVLSILQVSRRRNTRLGVTGILCYDGSRFFQLIEGEDACVDALYASICVDARHSGIVTLADGPISSRAFPKWSLAYRQVDGCLEKLGLFDASGTAHFVHDGSLGRKLVKLFSGPLSVGGRPD